MNAICKQMISCNYVYSKLKCVISQEFNGKNSSISLILCHVEKERRITSVS